MTERRPDEMRRKPAAFRLDEPKPAEAVAAPADGLRPTGRPPMVVPASVTIVPDAEDPFIGGADAAEEVDALTPPPASAPRRRFSFGRIAGVAFGAVASIAVGFWIDRLIETLFTEAPWLAWATLTLVVIGALALLVAIGREVVAIYRLAAVQTLKRSVEEAARERAPRKAHAAAAGVA
ncbi:MAG: TIGR01620 family protein, partial [Pararhizobium sp.]